MVPSCLSPECALLAEMIMTPQKVVSECGDIDGTVAGAPTRVISPILASEFTSEFTEIRIYNLQNSHQLSTDQARVGWDLVWAFLEDVFHSSWSPSQKTESLWSFHALEMIQPSFLRGMNA